MSKYEFTLTKYVDGYYIEKRNTETNRVQNIMIPYNENIKEGQVKEYLEKLRKVEEEKNDRKRNDSK